jgi:hypothetical protein
MIIIFNYFTIYYLLFLNLLFIQYQIKFFRNFIIIIKILIGLLFSYDIIPVSLIVRE